jgi:hypothetical protein
VHALSVNDSGCRRAHDTTPSPASPPHGADRQAAISTRRCVPRRFRPPEVTSAKRIRVLIAQGGSGRIATAASPRSRRRTAPTATSCATRTSSRGTAAWRARPRLRRG